MHPILFDLFGLKVYTYGVTASLAMIVGYLLAIFFAKKEGIESHKIENIFLFGIIGAILGARLAYVIEHHNEMRSFFSPFEIWQGGLDWFESIGGLSRYLP
jgi:Prolipoprotein diacylglyceryltransferase